MIKFLEKNIITVNRGIIAHGVNCQGKMGSGVAFYIRRHFPKAYYEYVNYCRRFDNNRRSMLGMVQLVEVSPLNSELFVANCFTQEFYGNDGQVYANLDAIKEAMSNVLTVAESKNYPVYIPRIGCGRGGLSWEDQVYPMLQQLCETEEFCTVPVIVCDFQPLMR